MTNGLQWDEEVDAWVIKIAWSIQNRVEKKIRLVVFGMYRMWKKGVLGVMQAALGLAYVEDSWWLWKP
jgi:hypothetical protein